MSSFRARVLVAGVGRGPFEGLAPVLERQKMIIERVDSPEVAVEIACKQPFDLLIFDADPVESIFGELVAKLRESSSASCTTSLLVLAEPGIAHSARELIGHGVNRVALLGDSPNLIGQQVAELLDIAPRAAVRLSTRLESVLDDGGKVARGNTENLSTTGMLMRTRFFIDVGSRALFEIHAVDRADPVEGNAEVVRRASFERGGVEGVGVRFLEFADDGEERVRAILAHIAES